MTKFYVSKLSIVNNKIESALVHEFVSQKITTGKSKDGMWFRKELEAGNEIYAIDKNHDNNWIIASEITYQKKINTITYEGSLPSNLTKRKSFVSYYHNGNQSERERFEIRFGDLIVNKSVNYNDINSENSDNYIKHLIQNGYLSDTTILIVLIGAKTKYRKHIDWEISGALNYRVGDRYAGLLGILLPSHPDFGKSTYYPNNLPNRFSENVESGYAILKDWDDDRAVMQNYIELAYQNRINTHKIQNKSILQMQKDNCK